MFIANTLYKKCCGAPAAVAARAQERAGRHATGDHAGALVHHRRALEMRERALPEGHPGIARLLSNIGATLGAAGDRAGELIYPQRALEMRERALPEGHPQIAYRGY